MGDDTHRAEKNAPRTARNAMPVRNSTSDRKHATKVFARLEVNKELVKFQIDS